MQDQAAMTPSDQDLLSLVHSLPYGDPRRDEACTVLVARHASIVRSCVHRYRGYPEPEELMQVGYVGLLKAINNFDPAVGDNLAAYAQPCVSGEIKRHFRDKRWQVRVHRQIQELRLAIRGADAELTQQLARPPHESELADYLGVPEAEINAAQAASQNFQVASLDAPATGEDGSAALGQQRLLMMRFYGNMTQAQIGEELGISQMHVSRLLDRALAYLRQKITDTSEPDPAEGDPDERPR
jgi:RNA polymerase sigma-B factor